MKIQGKAKITRYINKWLKEHGFSCKARMSTDFSLYKNEITYAFFVPQKHDKLFIKVCKELCPEIKSCDVFLLSFFHELGHIMTLYDFTDDDYYNYRQFVRSLCNKKKLTTKDYKSYYLCDIERTATEWGLHYIIDNADEINDFYTHLLLLEKEFLEKNKVED